MIHELKTHPVPFNDIMSGKKTFEYRKNDRNFGVGDVLLLKEGDLGGAGMTDHDLTFVYTGREFKCIVSYILGGGKFGIPEGYCIMSIKPESTTTLPVEGGAQLSDEEVDKMARACADKKFAPQSHRWQHVVKVYKEAITEYKGNLIVRTLAMQNYSGPHSMPSPAQEPFTLPVEDVKEKAKQYVDDNSEWMFDQNHFHLTRSFIKVILIQAYLAGAQQSGDECKDDDYDLWCDVYSILLRIDADGNDTMVKFIKESRSKYKITKIPKGE